MSGAVKLRPVVQAFAETMGRKLRANDWKGGWGNDSAANLLVRVVEEIAEMVPLIVAREESKAIVKLLHHAAADIEDAMTRDVASDRARARVRGEAADVANMVMMVADACEALRDGDTIGDARSDPATT